MTASGPRPGQVEEVPRLGRILIVTVAAVLAVAGLAGLAAAEAPGPVHDHDDCVEPPTGLACDGDEADPVPEAAPRTLPGHAVTPDAAVDEAPGKEPHELDVGHPRDPLDLDDRHPHHDGAPPELADRDAFLEEDRDGPVPDPPPSARSHAQQRDGTPHPPIVVSEDVGPAGLVLGHDPVTGEPISRPGSGVVAGNGTADDPYVIEGWRTERIRITGTEAHVVVRDNTVEDQDQGVTEAFAGSLLLFMEVLGNDVSGRIAGGIHVMNAANVTVEDNLVWGGNPGIEVRQSEDAVVRDNHVVSFGGEGIWVADSENVTVTDNDATGGRVEYAVSGSDDVEVRDNVASWAVAGFVTQGGSDVRVADNTVEEAENALVLIDGEDHVLEGNAIRNATDGFEVGGGENHTIEGNDVDVGDDGILTSDPVNLTVVDNAIEAGDNGIYSGATEDLNVTGNAIESSGWAGVAVDDADSPTITGNEITAGFAGLVILGSLDPTATDNELRGGGLYTWGHPGQLTFRNNTLDGAPIRFEAGLEDAEITGPAAQVVLVHASNVTVRGVALGGTARPLTIDASDNVTVADARIRDTAGSSSFHDGVRITSSENVTLRDVQVEAAGEGVDVFGSRSVVFEAVATRNVTWDGIDLWEVPDVAVRNSSVHGGGFDVYSQGVYAYRTPDLLLANNTVRARDAGVELRYGPDATLRENRFPGAGLEIHWFSPEDPGHVIGPSNTVDGDPIRYMWNASDVVVEGPVGQAFLFNSSDVTVRDVAVPDASYGVNARYSDDVTVADATFRNNTYGIRTWKVRNLTVTGSAFTDDARGVLVGNTSNVSVTEATFQDSGTGVFMYGGDNLTVRDVDVSGGDFGLTVHDTYDVPVDGVTVQETRIEDASWRGVEMSGVRDVAVSNVTVEAAGYDGFSWAGRNLSVTDSEFHDNGNDPPFGSPGAGLRLWHRSATVRGSEIVGNAVGVGITTADVGAFGVAVTVRDPVDVRHNWWGCPEGPLADACDDIADSDVDEAEFVPWSTEPHPDAGAS